MCQPPEVKSSLSPREKRVEQALCVSDVTDSAYLDHYLAFNIIMLQLDLIVSALVVVTLLDESAM